MALEISIHQEFRVFVSLHFNLCYFTQQSCSSNLLLLLSRTTSFCKCLVTYNSTADISAHHLWILSFSSWKGYEFFTWMQSFGVPPQTIITVLEILRTKGAQPMGYHPSAKYLFYSIHWGISCVAQGSLLHEGTVQLHYYSQFPAEWCHTVNRTWWWEFTVS